MTDNRLKLVLTEQAQGATLLRTVKPHSCMKVLTVLLIGFRCLFAQTSPCDLNSDGKVNVLDVQIAINQASGAAPCTNANLTKDGCTNADVQIITGAVLGGPCSVSAGAPAAPTGDSMTVYETDGVNQSGRPLTFGRPFVQGEFPQCLQPVISGTPITSYQVDVKNRWPDGSVKFAVISLIVPLLPAAGSASIAFQSASSCNNTGYLSQSQLLTFNSGNWGAEIDVTASGTSQAANAKTMLNALGFQDCQLTYWLQGPVVTQVIAQDCTAQSAYDFGWGWNGTTMSNPVTGNAATASLHPMFALSFYPSTNAVKVDFILENMWTGRMQDQQYSFVLKTGNPLTQAYSSAGQPYANASGMFTQLAATRWLKTFWSGMAPGHIRIDHNFPYLMSTKLFANYDLVNASVSPTSHSGTCNLLSNHAIADDDYTCFIKNEDATYPGISEGDKGDINGHALIQRSMNSGNDKGKLMSREDLEYLWNMGSCGTPNGLCAKAWDILTGEVDANPSSSLVGVPGGGGMWGAFAHMPIHQRESRASLGSFYCPGYDPGASAPNPGPNGTSSSSCGSGSGNTVGHGISRHADFISKIYPVAPVGNLGISNTPWGLELNCDHWVDFSYPAYLLTGSYFELEEVQQGANYCLFSLSPEYGYSGYSNGPFTWLSTANVRNQTWGELQQLYAATVSPDGTPEQKYYNAVIQSNAEILEGFYGITGSSLTPAAPNSTCTGYAPYTNTPSSATRWDFGHCGQGNGIFPALHDMDPGFCWKNDYYGAQQTVSAATSGNPLTLTMANTANLAGASANIWGATGPWSFLNTQGPQQGTYIAGTQITGVSGSQVAVQCPVVGQAGACSGLGALTGNVQMANQDIMSDENLTTDSSEIWMVWAYGVMANRAVEMGFSSWVNLARQVNLRLLEMLQDQNSNPYFVSLYLVGTKNGGGQQCSTQPVSLNPYLSSWAAFKDAIIPPFQKLATFDNVSTCAVDHAYTTTARALGTFLPGLADTCSQGSCTGSAAWTWLQGHVPFYTQVVSGSTACPAGVDVQAPLALAPRQ